jgi:putative ABC transport system permease protein
MNSRLRHLGILQSIGATPKQLRIVLLQEALITSSISIVFGTVLGIFLSIGVIRYMNILQSNLGLMKTAFYYHFLLFVFCSMLFRNGVRFGVASRKEVE